MPPSASRLLRAAVLILSGLELFGAAYILYALFIDDTTSDILTMLLSFVGEDDIWKSVVVPLAAFGAPAFLLGLANRLLWPALVLALAGPVVVAWLLV